MDQMTLASAAIPLYFYPFEKDGKFYTSGDNIAPSPQMYAVLHAVDKLGITSDDVRVVNVGGLSVLPETLDTEASLLDWILRLSSLFKPTKKFTMADQVSKMMHSKGHNLYDFNWPILPADWDSLYMSEHRDKRLNQIA